MSRLSISVVSCGLVSTTVNSSTAAAAAAAALHRAGACRVPVLPPPQALLPVRTVHVMHVPRDLDQMSKKCV